MLLKKREPKDKYEYDWWGYLHVNGKIQVKGYHTPEQLLDAEESTFVQRIVYPFKALNRDEAELIITKKLKDEEVREKKLFRNPGQGGSNYSSNRRTSTYGLEA
jgi:hypothetical protein